ncbi:MAG: AMP-binding protein [Vicinamibacteria bacterium]
MSEPGTLVSCLERAARSTEKVRFLDRDREELVTYRDVWERARTVAFGLTAVGVEPGDRVALAIPTGPDFYHAFFGVLAAGAVPLSLPLPPRFGSGRDFAESAAAAMRATGALRVLTGAPKRGRFPEHEAIALEDLPRGAREEAAIVERGPDDLALVQLSSGTTGSPKPIGLTHRQLLANARAIRDRVLESYPLEEGYEHGGLSWLPLYHDMGLVGAVLVALVHPGPLTLMKPEEFVARPARWLKAISRYRATISAAPHFAYQLALERVRDEEIQGIDLSCWLLALDGAEPVTASTLERFYGRFRSYGLRREALTPVYGLAEASLAVTFSNPAAPFHWRTFDRSALVAEDRAIEAPDGQAIVSCGRTLPDVDVRIVDESGEPLEENRVGRVLVRGPSVTSEGAGPDGFLDTGDRGFLLERELYLWGRSGDLLILRGRNYPPEMIEEAAERAPGLRPGSIAAVGLATDEGEGLCLLAERGHDVRNEEEALTIREIRARVVERCGVDPHLVRILEPGSLPRTSSGKIRRQEAARLFVATRV